MIVNRNYKQRQNFGYHYFKAMKIENKTPRPSFDSYQLIANTTLSKSYIMT